MAASGYTPIQHYYSTTTTNVPSAGNLALGEFAINTTDEILFYKNTGGTVKSFSLTGGGGGTGTVTSVAASVPSFLSVSGSPITTSGTLAITYSGTALPVANGGTGITSFGTGVATWLGTPSSANLAAAMTDETGTGSLVFGTSPNLTTPKITALLEVKTSIGASNIDLSVGNYFSKTISGTTTFTVSNVPASGTAACFILDLTNGGSATVNWMTGTKWAGGSAPTLTTSGRDTLGFFTYDGGTTWNGFVLGKAMA